MHLCHFLPNWFHHNITQDQCIFQPTSLINNPLSYYVYFQPIFSQLVLQSRHIIFYDQSLHASTYRVSDSDAEHTRITYAYCTSNTNVNQDIQYYKLKHIYSTTDKILHDTKVNGHIIYTKRSTILNVLSVLQ